jgi:hypothetical protein
MPEVLLEVTLQVDMLAVIQVDTQAELLTEAISLVELPVVGTAVVAMGQEVGDLELVNGAAEATTVVKEITGPQVSKRQTTIKCYKVKVSLIRWVWARVPTVVGMVGVTAPLDIIQ